MLLFSTVSGLTFSPCQPDLRFFSAYSRHLNRLFVPGCSDVLKDPSGNVK